jgi:histidinol-phosphatase (PHP family)
LESDWSSLSFFFRIIVFQPDILTIIAKISESLFKHNFHTHTAFCDGSSEPEQYVEAAIAAGLMSIGFSGHAPVPFENNFAIKNAESLKKYCKEIIRLKESYKDQIKVFLALEADYIPDITLDFSAFRQKCDLDYIIGSVHLVKSADGQLWFIDGSNREIWLNGLSRNFNGNIKEAVTAYYHQISMMLINQKPDVLGHFDKIKMHNRDEFFREDDPWYLSLINQTLQVIKETACIVEVTPGAYIKSVAKACFRACIF